MFDVHQNIHSFCSVRQLSDIVSDMSILKHAFAVHYNDFYKLIIRRDTHKIVILNKLYQG